MQRQRPSQRSQRRRDVGLESTSTDPRPYPLRFRSRFVSGPEPWSGPFFSDQSRDMGLSPSPTPGVETRVLPDDRRPISRGRVQRVPDVEHLSWRVELSGSRRPIEDRRVEREPPPRPSGPHDDFDVDRRGDHDLFDVGLRRKLERFFPAHRPGSPRPQADRPDPRVPVEQLESIRKLGPELQDVQLSSLSTTLPGRPRPDHRRGLPRLRVPLRERRRPHPDRHRHLSGLPPDRMGTVELFHDPDDVADGRGRDSRLGFRGNSRNISYSRDSAFEQHEISSVDGSHDRICRKGIRRGENQLLPLRPNHKHPNKHDRLFERSTRDDLLF